MREKHSNIERLPSLSLCEQLNVGNLSRVMENIRRAKSLERVYLGSSFCCRYLFQAANDVLKEAIAICDKKGIEVTLVLPIASERFCSSMLSFLDDFTANYANTITEITCNDHGILSHCAKAYPQKLNIGRLLSKDAREIREPYYTDLALVPSILERDLEEVFPMEKISSIELDPIHKYQDVQANAYGADISLYMDWCYQTTGKICEQASIQVPMREKFRPSAACNGECQDFAIFYEGQMGFPYCKHGTTVYYRQEGARLISESGYRRIYSPLLSEIFLQDPKGDYWDVFMDEAA